jgi:hypothetical protein
MPLPCREVVHVRLKILDDTALVRGRQVCAGVREGKGADRGVVRLKDGLKVEREAVPERELSAS